MIVSVNDVSDDEFRTLVETFKDTFNDGVRKRVTIVTGVQITVIRG